MAVIGFTRGGKMTLSRNFVPSFAVSFAEPSEDVSPSPWQHSTDADTELYFMFPINQAYCRSFKSSSIDIQLSFKGSIGVLQTLDFFLFIALYIFINIIHCSDWFWQLFIFLYKRTQDFQKSALINKIVFIQIRLCLSSSEWNRLFPLFSMQRSLTLTKTAFFYYYFFCSDHSSVMSLF